MKNISALKATLREVDKAKYSELGSYTKADIWRNTGPGEFYLVSLLAKMMRLQPNSLVLDLGCGSVQASVYLADNFKAKVI